jgi:hypothetical protein
MLGDQIGEDAGQVTGRRVLPGEDGKPVVEVSFRSRGKLLGHDVINTGTYVSVAGADGVVRGEGQGMVMSADGQAATWKGGGVGQFVSEGEGFIHYTGAIYFTGSAEAFASLNAITAVFEFDVDREDNTTSKTWEWK